MFLMIASCDRRDARETLRQAERLVSGQPDSALWILEGFDCRDADPETQAYHRAIVPMADRCICDIPRFWL